MTRFLSALSTISHETYSVAKTLCTILHCQIKSTGLQALTTGLLCLWHQIITFGEGRESLARSTVWWVKMWVSVFYTLQATRKKPSTPNWVSRHWLCALVPSSWNRFHMAGLETFPVGRAPANSSFCKVSAATLGAHPWELSVLLQPSPGIQGSVCLCPTILTTVGLSHRHA